MGKKCIGIMVVFAVIVMAAITPAEASPRKLVRDAEFVMQTFLEDDNFSENTRYYLQRSRAVLIVPSFYKAGFVVGGATGSGVLLARGDDGQWSSPAFVDVGSASVGFQAGASASEMVVFVMSDTGLNAVINNQLRLGADAGVAFATVGAGVSGALGLTTDADFMTFSKSVGLFGGISFEGAAIEVDQVAMQQFYGTNAALYPTLVENRYTNPHADRLRGLLQHNVSSPQLNVIN